MYRGKVQCLQDKSISNKFFIVIVSELIDLLEIKDTVSFLPLYRLTYVWKYLKKESRQ